MIIEKVNSRIVLKIVQKIGFIHCKVKFVYVCVLAKKVSGLALADMQFFCKANYANIIAKFFLAFCVCLCCCKKVSDLAVADMTAQYSGQFV